MSAPEVRHARAIRPFPTRRLLSGLARLQGRSAYIGEVMARLAASEADGPEAYRYELGEAIDCLEDLAEAARAMREECSYAWDSADGDWERAVDAMQVIIAGLNGGES